MLYKNRFTIITCIVIAILLLVAAVNALYDPFDSMEGKQQGRFEHSVRVPILMYHHFADDGSPDVTISGDAFERQMKALHDAGYTTISFEQLRDYVYNGAALPERPLLITIDDGYMSVYDTAYPILKKYGMKATAFIIGVFYGQSVYKGVAYWKIIPHFGDAEAAEMEQSGLISIQSHSYDMHQYQPYETDYRDAILRKRGESRAAYKQAIATDFGLAAAQIENAVGKRPFVYSYPFGKRTYMAEAVLKSMGVEITLITTPGTSLVVRNAPDSLFALKRLNVPGDMTAEELLNLIK